MVARRRWHTHKRITFNAMAVPIIHRVHLKQNVGPASEVLLPNNKLEIQREAEMTNVLCTLYNVIIFYQSNRCLTDLGNRFPT
jgi:hypothetical protein